MFLGFVAVGGQYVVDVVEGEAGGDGALAILSSHMYSKGCVHGCGELTTQKMACAVH